MDKYAEICKNEVRYEEMQTEDADYILVAFGLSARICHKAVETRKRKRDQSRVTKTYYTIPVPNERLTEMATKRRDLCRLS